MIDDAIAELSAKMESKSDITHGLDQLFKDYINKDEGKHDIDLRSRLIAKAARGHSVINFLQTIKVKEAHDCSLADGLDVLSLSLKRHVVSLKGLSRQEIIDIFKAEASSRQSKADFNLFQPIGGK